MDVLYLSSEAAEKGEEGKQRVPPFSPPACRLEGEGNVWLLAVASLYPYKVARSLNPLCLRRSVQ